jgi:flagellar protein FlaF
MHSAAQAYDKNTKATLSPRDLEAHLLMKAAAKLQAVKDDWSHAGEELTMALLYNRKLWTVFTSSMMEEEARSLPATIRENIANLGIFIFNRTLDIEAAPAPEKLTALIDINRNVAAGLRGQA